jgi:HAMP domain-containing protein
VTALAVIAGILALGYAGLVLAFWLTGRRDHMERRAT